VVLYDDANMRLALILGGDFFTAAVLSSALTKLVLRFEKLATEKAKFNGIKAEVCDDSLSS
jgi:hypothetical protein